MSLPSVICTGTYGKTMYCAVPVSLVRWTLLSDCSGSMHALVYGIAHTHTVCTSSANVS